MKKAFRGLPFLLAARAAARRADALAQSPQPVAFAEPVPDALAAARPNFELVRRYVRR